MKKTILLCILLGFCLQLLSAEEDPPTITIHTSWERDQEGTLYFSLSGSDEDFESVTIDAGYGKKKPTEVDDNGNFPVKGNVIKIYGHFTGITTPSEVTLSVVFAENDFIKDVAITQTKLSEQTDLRPCKSLTYASFMDCGFTSFDFSLLPASIEELYIFFNQFSTLTVPNMPNLQNLVAGSNTELHYIDVSEVLNLKELDISDSPKLSYIDLSHNIALTHFEGFGCAFKTIDLSHCDLLENVSLSDNGLTELKLGKTNHLSILELKGNNLPSIDLSKMPELKMFSIGGNSRISMIDLSHNPLLMSLAIQDTKISYIDVSHLRDLNTINAAGCPLTTLDLSGLESLQTCSVERCYSIEELCVRGCPQLSMLFIAGNKLGFDVMHQIAEDLPTVEYGLFGVFSVNDPLEGNLIYSADVELCSSKGFIVMQRDYANENAGGIPYPGIPNEVTHISSSTKGFMIIDHGSDIEFCLNNFTAPQHNECLTLIDMNGYKRLIVPVAEDKILVRKEDLGRGKYIASIGNQHVAFIL